MNTIDTAIRMEMFVRKLLHDFPWQINVTDWTGRGYALGRNQNHWRDTALEIDIRTEAAGKDLIALRPLRFLERFVDGEVEMHGNLYLLSDIRGHADLSLSLRQLIGSLLASKGLYFQTASRARANIKSHYDIPQRALNIYLDQVYMSYSCALFEQPERLEVSELTRVGKGKGDSFDSLEKAQWRKFKDAVDFINPREGESLLDIGCGYGGQLAVAMAEAPFGSVVGWTHSSNQVKEGRTLLKPFDDRQWELNEGDYRQEQRTYDHLTSTGMVSHVGPRGLAAYVQNVRSMIRTGGRYVHHGLMTPRRPNALDAEIGIAFNKKYVWPGFHWFTLAEHVKALEENGFEVVRMRNLSPHYGKTTAAWYERMMANEPLMIASLGEKTFRAWQIYLAGASAGFRNGTVHVYRTYCRAV
jgi:cyclopropane-fatty-acyl-phospholipid synthase